MIAINVPSDYSLAEFLDLAPRSLILQALLLDMRAWKTIGTCAALSSKPPPPQLIAMIFMALRPSCPPYRDRSHSNDRLINVECVYQTLPKLL